MPRTILALLLIFGAATAFAQPFPSFEKKELLNGSDTLRYRIQYPLGYDAAKKYPLVVVMHGSGEEEHGCCKTTGKVLVALDGIYRRPTEVDLLLGDPAKALRQLGWKHRTTFEQLVTEMVEADRMVIKRMGDRYVQPVLHAAQ